MKPNLPFREVFPSLTAIAKWYGYNLSDEKQFKRACQAWSNSLAKIDRRLSSMIGTKQEHAHSGDVNDIIRYQVLN